MLRSNLASSFITAFAALMLCVKGVAVQADVIYLQSAEVDPVILEVIDHYVGRWPFAGKYTHFRLFESGRCEYEKPRKLKDFSKMGNLRACLKSG